MCAYLFGRFAKYRVGLQSISIVKSKVRRLVRIKLFDVLLQKIVFVYSCVYFQRICICFG